MAVNVEVRADLDPGQTSSRPSFLARPFVRDNSFVWCMFCPQAISEVWRRVKMEFVIEWPLFLQRWKIILFGIVMQYVHGIFTQLAHRMHHPQPEPLHDIGFELTPELGPEHFWVSEAIFITMFISFVLWTFTPFFFQEKRFYTAVLWARILMVLVACQALRILSFSVTQLPGSSHHCRLPEPTARRDWPKHWSGHVLIDVQRQATRSCGDLIFSSHTTFVLTGVLTYNEYGSLPVVKVLAWIGGGILSVLIIASRKHYTVDIVIAWYTVPLVFFTMCRRWTTRRPVSDMEDSFGVDDGVLDTKAAQEAPENDQRVNEQRPVIIVTQSRGMGQKLQLHYGDPGTATAMDKAPVRARGQLVTQDSDR